MPSNIPDAVCAHVIDDDEDMRKSIEWTLASVGHCVSTYASAKDFLDSLPESSPCCVIIDLLLPGMSGLKLCQHLNESDRPYGVVMISGHGDITSAVSSMKLGAVDFLEKPCSREQLLDAVYRASEWAKQAWQQRQEERETRVLLARLTAREREVLDLIATGLVTKQISKRLSISIRTVDVHRSNIMSKLGIQSHTQLAHLLAVKHRLSQAESQESRSPDIDAY